MRGESAETGGGTPFARLREMALELPGVEEGTSYGTPSLKVKGKMLVRLWEDGETLVLKTDFYERDHLIESDPATFFLTDHYREYPYVLVRLASADRTQMRSLLVDSWRRAAPKKLVAEYDRAHGAG